MDLRFIREGAAFTIYAMELGETLQQFLAALEQSNLKEHDRVLARLDHLAERGPSRRKNEFNDLGAGLFEAKTSAGSRVIFFYEQNHIVICTHGFAKKSRKTPKHLLDAALDRKRAYEQAKRAGERTRIIKSQTQDDPRRMP